MHACAFLCACVSECESRFVARRNYADSNEVAAGGGRGDENDENDENANMERRARRKDTAGLVAGGAVVSHMCTIWACEDREWNCKS